MSDALCGPSNALQNFQKHASVDRTLQQDRLTSRQSPSQGFRSQNPNEGILDPEFAAFESNLAGPSPLPELQHAGHFVAPRPPQQFSAPHHVENANWASDFQRLQISGPSNPIAQQRLPSAAPATSMQQGWQNEFMNQYQQHTPVQHQQRYGGGFQSSFAPSFPMHATPINHVQSQETANQQPAAETFDESAFAAAFEQARADLETQAAEVTETEVHSMNESFQQDATVESEAREQIRIGSDTIPYAEKEDTQARVHDGDELAKTAGQLLDSVSHDQSQKFKESNFLALMRRIRDREVHVEGDEFRETSQSLHPGGKYYPEGQHKQQQQIQTSSNQDSNVKITPNGLNLTQDTFEPDLPPYDPLDRGQTRPDFATEESQRQDSLETSVSGGQGDDDSLYAGWNFGDRWA